MAIRVLLVDDHTIVRDGLRALLASQSDMCVVGGASNGAEAVQLVRQLHPDVVVMDIAMPGMTGLEAAKEIKASDPSVKIIVLTMHSTAEHVFRSLQAGALGYLMKESAGAEVVNAIRTVHAGSYFFSHQIGETMVEEYLRQRDGAQSKGPLESLSARELQVLKLTTEGRSSAEIAEILSLSPKTVDTYRSRLMDKLSIHDLPSLVKFAIQHGLTSV